MNRNGLSIEDGSIAFDVYDFEDTPEGASLYFTFDSVEYAYTDYSYLRYSYLYRYGSTGYELIMMIPYNPIRPNNEVQIKLKKLFAFLILT